MYYEYMDTDIGIIMVVVILHVELMQLIELSVCTTQGDAGHRPSSFSGPRSHTGTFDQVSVAAALRRHHWLAAQELSNIWRHRIQLAADYFSPQHHFPAKRSNKYPLHFSRKLPSNYY
jgi:hypothetical protein